MERADVNGPTSMHGLSRTVHMIDPDAAYRLSRPMWWVISSSIVALASFVLRSGLILLRSFPALYDVLSLADTMHWISVAVLLVSLWVLLRRVNKAIGSALPPSDKTLQRLFLATLIAHLFLPWLFRIAVPDVVTWQLIDAAVNVTMLIGSFGLLRTATVLNQQLTGVAPGSVLRTIHRCWLAWWGWMIFLALFGLYLYMQFGNPLDDSNPTIQTIEFWWQLAWIPYIFVIVPAVWSIVELRNFRKQARRLIERTSCPACGYDLRGDLATGCPECGWGRRELPEAN